MNKINVWQLSDKKAGHLRQAEGLIKGLSEYLSISNTVIDIERFIPKNLDLFRSKKPDLIIGAGNKTQLMLAMLGKLYSVKTIYIMKPTFPTSWFNICIVPNHDKVKATNNILFTEGPINPMPCCKNKIKNKGLILIGGDSKHYLWENEKIIKYIKSIISKYPKIHWTISDSRRTPKSIEKSLKLLEGNHALVEYISFKSVSNEWLLHNLKESTFACISADSISMIYEAITSGCQVGVLPLNKKKFTKVNLKIEQLIKNGWVCLPYEQPWSSSRELNESKRCASIVVDRLELINS